MSKFKVGDMVVPHEFDGPPGWDNKMREFLERPGKIIDTWKVDSVTDRFYHIGTNKWVWPERALAPSSDYPPRYDLAEFTKAAMAGVCAHPYGVEPHELARIAVEIGKATIKALQEAEKEGES